MVAQIRVDINCQRRGVTARVTLVLVRADVSTETVYGSQNAQKEGFGETDNLGSTCTCVSREITTTNIVT